MKKYRKKPVEITALQYTDETRQQIIDWCNCQHSSIDDDGCEYELENLRINTLEGTMMANKGDYIIQGVQGEFYPCKPDIFEATYELIT